MSAVLNTTGVARRSAKITPAIDIHSLPDDALVRRELVLQLFGYSRTTLWRRIRAKQFPPAIEDGGIKGWTAGQIRAALATRHAQAHG